MADPSPLIDANLLLWAYHEEMPRHRDAASWWETMLEQAPMVGLPWPVTLAFLRVSTNRRVLPAAVSMADAWQVVRSWLDRPNVWVPTPTERHPALLETMLLEGGGGANDTTDAHLAALAVEWGLELLTADRGFARYPGLRWRNPLVKS